MPRPSKTAIIVASRLCIDPAKIDKEVLKAAKSAYSSKSSVLYDALGNKGQLVGNVPKYISIAITYDWLING